MRKGHKWKEINEQQKNLLGDDFEVVGKRRVVGRFKKMQPRYKEKGR